MTASTDAGSSGGSTSTAQARPTRVRVTATTHYGLTIGKVYDVGGWFEGLPCVRNDSGLACYLATTKWEPASPAATWVPKVGDVVACTLKGDSRPSHFGRVKSVSAEMAWVDVFWDTMLLHASGQFGHACLRPATPAELRAAPLAAPGLAWLREKFTLAAANLVLHGQDDAFVDAFDAYLSAYLAQRATGGEV